MRKLAGVVWERHAFGMALNRNEASIRLSYGAAIDVLMQTLDTDAEARSAFAARVRQLQRVGLCKPTGSYNRFTYGLVELAAIATAFQMMSAFMLPIVAVRFLNERWSIFVPPLVAGTGDAMGRAFWRERDVPQPDTPIIFMEGVALSRLGQKSASDSRYDGPLGKTMALSPGDVIGRAFGTVTAGVMIDTRSYMPRLIGALEATEPVSRRQLEDEIDRLRYSALIGKACLSDANY